MTTPAVVLLIAAVAAAAAGFAGSPMSAGELDALSAAEAKQARAYLARAKGDLVWGEAAAAAHSPRQATFFRERQARALRAARRTFARAAEHRARATVARGGGALAHKRAAEAEEAQAVREHGISIPAAAEEREAGAAMRRSAADLARAKTEEAEARGIAPLGGFGGASDACSGRRQQGDHRRPPLPPKPLTREVHRLKLLYAALALSPRNASSAPLVIDAATVSEIRHCQALQLRSKESFLLANAAAHTAWARFHRLRLRSVAAAAAAAAADAADATTAAAGAARTARAAGTGRGGLRGAAGALSLPVALREERARVTKQVRLAAEDKRRALEYRHRAQALEGAGVGSAG